MSPKDSASPWGTGTTAVDAVEAAGFGASFFGAAAFFDAPAPSSSPISSFGPYLPSTAVGLWNWLNCSVHSWPPTPNNTFLPPEHRKHNGFTEKKTEVSPCTQRAHVSAHSGVRPSPLLTVAPSSLSPSLAWSNPFAPIAPIPLLVIRPQGRTYPDAA